MTTENRSAAQSTMRAMIDEVQAVCDTIRNSYPERYPVPLEIDAVLGLEDSVKAIARSSI